MELNDKQHRALATICDTFAPGDGAGLPSASASGTVVVVEGRAAANPRAAESAQLAKLLSLWDSRLGGMLLGRGTRRFSTLSQEGREAALLTLADSSNTQRRALFQALKGAATTAYYLNPGPTGTSPLWSAMGCPGPPGRPAFSATAPTLSPETVTGSTTLECDVVVVGSGAGGGTAAAVLAGAASRLASRL